MTTVIRDHTARYVHDDSTIVCCWNADRLDLPRVGINPHPNYLGTDAAKMILKERRST